MHVDNTGPDFFYSMSKTNPCPLTYVMANFGKNLSFNYSIYHFKVASKRLFLFRRFFFLNKHT
jgi:hypothetical protein